MLAVHGIYENGKIKLLDPIPFKKKAKVIITVLDEEITEEKSARLDIFDDLIGVISSHKDSAKNHDAYIYAKENV